MRKKLLICQYAMYSFLAAAAVVLVMDAAWFSFSVPRLYSPALSDVLGRPWSFSLNPHTAFGAALAYAAVAASAVLVSSRDRAGVLPPARAAAKGAMVGAAAYAMYNGTGMALFGESWGLTVLLADTAWGGLVGAAAAAAAAAVGKTIIRE